MFELSVLHWQPPTLELVLGKKLRRQASKEADWHEEAMLQLWKL
jgi:hypothetical protein